jgi:hypothetical protein
MTKDILVIPDQHAHPDHHNKRADWLGQYMVDIKPEIVINMGDLFDMPSLSSYDKGKASFHGKSYEKDIESGLDFHERMWAPVKKQKKKQPYKVFLHGNHENRLRKVLEYDEHLAGDRFGVSFRNYAIQDYYHEEVPYEGQTPGIYTCEGISFAHYFISGIMGRAVSGEHHAYSLIAKQYTSCVAAHSHLVDYAVRTDTHGRHIQGLVCGVYQDYESRWAGRANDLWWRGIVHLRGVENGNYDPEFISLGRIMKEYG